MIVNCILMDDKDSLVTAGWDSTLIFWVGDDLRDKDIKTNRGVGECDLTSDTLPNF